ncbi:MAG: YebC/PmpR family DNA-binding transcriptional regulator, partial [Pseudomonadota bacterium]
YMFSKQGMISYAEGKDEDAIMEAALEAGAEDIINNDDGSIDVMTSPEDFPDVKDAMISAGHEPDNAEVSFSASTNAELDEKDADKLLRMVDMLEDLDDVQNVYTNAEISDEILESID